MELRRELPVHADRQEARRSDGARLRRGHDPARRPRIERLHFRGARDGGDALGHLLVVTSGIGALKGPLHGGANQDVIKWLLTLGDEEAAVDAVKSTLARKVKIPGFGHRVYRTEDPRATHLRVLSEELGKRTGHEKLYRLSKRMEETIKTIKGLATERGLLFGFGVLFAGHPGGPVHADFRGKPHGRLDRPRARAIPQQPPDSPARRIQGQSRRPDLDSRSRNAKWTNARITPIRRPPNRQR
jgi:hypothetical protein